MYRLLVLGFVGHMTNPYIEVLAPNPKVRPGPYTLPDPGVHDDDLAPPPRQPDPEDLTPTQVYTSQGEVLPDPYDEPSLSVDGTGRGPIVKAPPHWPTVPPPFPFVCVKTYCVSRNTHHYPAISGVWPKYPRPIG